MSEKERCKMSNEFIEDIYSKMKEKSTEELLKIWTENDKAQYSEEAFEAIKQLLAERGVEIPTQKELLQPTLQEELRLPPLTWLHKLSGGIILVAAIFAAIHAIFMITLPDQTIVEMSKVSIKMQRDSSNPPSQFANKTDKEIDRFVEDYRSEVIQAVRSEFTKMGGLKGILSILLIITGFGVLYQKRSPTRLFAVIIGVVLFFAAITQYPKLMKQLKLYDQIESPLLMTVDYIWYILIPLTIIACFIAVIILGERRAN
jgi:hypothetical protein